MVATTTQKRSGIIPVTVDTNGELWFLLAIEYLSREYADFGGALKKGETFADAARREFAEESCGIISLETIDLEKTTSVKTDFCKIYFPVIDNSYLHNIHVKFKEAQKKIPKHHKHYYEIVNVQWVNLDTFAAMVYNAADKRMWNIMKNILNKYSIETLTQNLLVK